MRMLGVGFKLTADKSQIGKIVKILLIRFGVAAVLAVLAYQFLPFAIEVRKAVVLLLFSPFGSAIPPFTAELGEDAGLSSAINSISVICSIVLMVSILVALP